MSEESAASSYRLKRVSETMGHSGPGPTLEVGLGLGEWECLTRTLGPRPGPGPAFEVGLWRSGRV